MSMERHGASSQSWRSQFIPEIDRKAAAQIAYWNTLNAFQGIDMLGASEKGDSLNMSRTSQERFVYCLAILDGIIDEDKDEDFRKDKEGTAYTFTNIPDLLIEHQPNEFGRFDAQALAEYFRYWYRIDGLLRRKGMFLTGKVPHARI